MFCEGRPAVSLVLLLLLVIQGGSSSDASSIGNYDVLQCYKLNLTFHYKFPGGLTSSTINQQTAYISNLFNTISGLLGLLPKCSGVSVSRKAIVTSPPGESSVFFRIPVTFTASTSIANDQVDPRITGCIDELTSNYKGFLDSNTPKISQGGLTAEKWNDSTISDKESCCGGSIPPPCCAAGAVKVSSSKCGCTSGFYFVSNSFCARCPANTYQGKLGKTSCNRCPAKKQTFNKTGMTSESNCSDKNPLQLRVRTYPFLPYNIETGTVVGNVTVTGSPASLVQPFLYYIDRVTQRPQSRVRQRQRSPTSLKRRRRDEDDDDDVCKDAGSFGPNSYFCINRLSGSIEVSQGFVFEDGNEYELAIRVTDSDPWGKTENTATVALTLRDQCKEIRKFYHDAVKFCKNASLVVSGEAILCPRVMNCLQPLYKWQKALNSSSEALREECSLDPQNMTALTQKYSSCMGPPTITLSPVSSTLAKGAAAVLTCNASSPLPVKITWFKNSQQIGSGSQLQIGSFENDDQGDYYCKFSTDLTSSVSKPALLVMKDALTSIVSFTIVNEKYQDDLLDPRSSRYSDFQVNIQRNLENYFNSGDPSWSYQVKLVKFRDSFGKVGVVLVVYSPAMTADMTSYYSRLEALLADNSEMNKLLKPLKVSRKSVRIRSTTHCLVKETGKVPIMGVFEWQLTVIGQNSPSLKCPYGPPAASATRLCGGNFSAGGIWKNPDVSRCKYKSERTNKLNNLAKTRIDKQNVVKVTKEVKDLTSEADDMNEADAILIADVIGNVVSLDDSLNETAPDVVTVVDNVMNMKREYLQESQRSNKASSKFIQALDRIAKRLPLSPNKSSRLLVAPSVAIQSRRADPASFSGMTLAVKPSAADPNKLTPDSMARDELPMADVQTSITLPEIMFEGKNPSGRMIKIGFVIYQNDKFFQPVIPDDLENKQGASSVMSRVVSSSVQDMAFDNLSKPVELVFEPALKVDQGSEDSVCVFWDFNALGGLGNWSDQGCRLMKTEAGRVKCHCDHMTNFAVLFSASGPKTHEERHAMALSIISYVGCAVSLLGLTLTFITYSLFRNLRKTNQQPILMSLCVSLMFLLIVFIAGAGQTETLIGCRIVAVLLHYFALSSVMWMGVEGYNMYMSFVKVMATYQAKFMLKASAVAWGVPAVFVIITVSAATSYYGNDDVCVLYGIPFQAAQFGPILVIILINFVIFILAMRSLSRSGSLVSAEKKTTSYQRARTSVAILLLLGLTWVFGALAISRAQIVFDYLFCIFNSLQGFLIFYFHCLRQQEVRNQWRMFLTGKGLRLPMSETYSHTEYPKTFSKGHKYQAGTPNTSFAVYDPTKSRKATVTCSVDNTSPKLKPRHDVVPAEV